MKKKLESDSPLRAANCSPSSGRRTISGNPSMLRNADVGHMLELREKLATAERETEKWKAECKRQWLHLSQARHNARAIQNIRWGYDGDCGADRLANLIEEDCDRGMISPENDQGEAQPPAKRL